MAEPKIGDRRTGVDVGMHWAGYSVYVQCADCGKARWVREIHGKPESTRCRTCASKMVAASRRGKSNHNKHTPEQQHKGDWGPAEVAEALVAKITTLQGDLTNEKTEVRRLGLEIVALRVERAELQQALKTATLARKTEWWEKAKSCLATPGEKGL